MALFRDLVWIIVAMEFLEAGIYLFLLYMTLGWCDAKL